MRKKFHELVSRYAYLLPVLTVILTLLVLFFTLSPSDIIGGQRLGNYDKTGHLVLFGSWTYLYGLFRYFRHSGEFNLFTVFLVGILFGIFVELLQYVLPFERNADFFDVAFDAIGAFIAILLLRKSISED